MANFDTTHNPLGRPVTGAYIKEQYNKIRLELDGCDINYNRSGMGDDVDGPGSVRRARARAPHSPYLRHCSLPP